MSDQLTLPNPLEGVDPRVFTNSLLPIRPWIDPLVDTLGFDPRSAYVERTRSKGIFELFECCPPRVVEGGGWR